MIKVANAPVSYGVFELTIGRPGLPGPDDLVGAVAAAGYDGIDLGPLGFLGGGGELRRRLDGAGLDLAGGYVQLRFPEPAGLRDDLDVLEQTLDVFDAVRDRQPHWLPKPTLADAGGPERAANPGRGRDRADLRLDGSGWKRLAAGVTEAVGRCRARGYEPTFHHHACTYVEAPQEIERLLELTDVGLCLDTGHLLLGGGDPIRALSDWGPRVNHLQVKDIHLDVIERIVAERAPMMAVWERGAFCELATGDLDVDALLAAITGLRYDGWVVVEQDRLLGADSTFDAAAAAQARNRALLRERGW